MTENHFAQDFATLIERDHTLDDKAKVHILRNLANMKQSRVHILITGATGSGKSSTINALFNANHAKIGQGVNPETQEIALYEYDNVTLYDTPGLGDSPAADAKHTKNIIEKLQLKMENGDYLIDLVLVILDGGSKDLGTSYDLINKIIVPNLGAETNRLIIAINQADMVMKGRFWNMSGNHPEPELYHALENKTISVKKRIKESTGIDVDPIYYSAGYKDGDLAQHPFNLTKLLWYIIKNVKDQKRVVVIQDVNRSHNSWNYDDRKYSKIDYKEEIKKTSWESVKSGISEAWSGVKEVATNIWKKIWG